MHVRFWGTRGSIATPGPGTTHFGGNTSCVALRTDAGDLLVFDVGTGARLLGAELMRSGPRPTKASILLGHTHTDHIQGFPFFVPCFVPGNQIAVYAPRGSQRSLHQVLAGQMEFTYFPVELDQLPARITYHELAEGPHEIGGARVIAQYLHHPAMTFGYRVEVDGAAVVYLVDHEPYADTRWRHDAVAGHVESLLHEGDRRHARFMSGADLVIHDGQYTPEEYPAKKTWGHSPFDYVVELAAAAGARRLALTHHDPVHDDLAVAEIERRAKALAKARGSTLDVFCAYEGCEVEVRGTGEGRRLVWEPRPDGAAAAIRSLRILVVDDDPDLRRLVMTALRRDGHVLVEAPNGREALRMVQEHSPEFVVLDLEMPEMGGFDVLRELRASPATARLPVLILTVSADEASTRAGFDVGATDYLTKPFSMPQLAARVRACMARAAHA
jgi:CheY-like chemotaxis protein/phosphoribosyl 1,2-cyclic phosphodiesterase